MNPQFVLLFVFQIIGICVLAFILGMRGSLGHYTYGLFETLEDRLASFPKAQAKAIARVQEIDPDNKKSLQHLEHAENSYLEASNCARLKDRISAHSCARNAHRYLRRAVETAESRVYKDALRESLQPAPAEEN